MIFQFSSSEMTKWDKQQQFSKAIQPIFSRHVLLYPAENYDWEAKVANSSELHCNSPALNGPGYSIDHFSTAYTRPRSVRHPVVRGRSYSTICSIRLSSNSSCLSYVSFFARVPLIVCSSRAPFCWLVVVAMMVVVICVSLCLCECVFLNVLL